jgi:hypothetical protein
MASCGYCGTTVLFGGTREGELRFCNAECQRKGFVAAVAQHIPDHVVSEQVWKVYQGLCPQCGGSGPVDVHTSYRVWSALALTSWSSRPHIVCRSCGSKARLGDAAFSLVLGWWGFPWGLIMTPVQVFRNAAGLVRTTGSTAPSSQLTHLIRLRIAADAIEAQRARGA